MASKLPAVKPGAVGTVGGTPQSATQMDPAGATPYAARPGADAGYAAYLQYAAAVAHLWTVETGTVKTVQDVIAAGGSYAYDPGTDAAAYKNITASVVDGTSSTGWNGGEGAHPTATASTPPTTATPTAIRQYQQVDNGVSSIAGYGFGDGNRYTQGAPIGGYGDPTGTSGSGLVSRNAGPVQNATTSTTTGAASTAGLSTAQRDAWGYLRGILDQYGLGSLSQFVISELTAGRSQDEIALDLQQTPEFKQAFPEIAARTAAGLPAISPGEIISYRNNAIQMMRAAGLPQGFYDSPADLQSLIGNDVSLSELSDRIQMAKDATYNIDPATQARLTQMYGLQPGSGDLTAFFLDDKRAEPLLQRAVNAAKIGGAADTVGYGGLNNATALDLAQAGVTADQARQGFNQLGTERQLFTGLPGQAEQNIGQGQQLAAEFLGNIDAQQAIEQRRRGRLATFDDGGGFASSSKGMSAGAAQQG